MPKKMTATPGNRIVTTLDRGWRIEGFDPERGLAAGAYREDYEPQDAVPAAVPGTVQHALHQAGRIPDPLAGFQAAEAWWVERKEWWYFYDFAAPRHGPGQRVLLRFEGIAYRAEIWVNGVQIGRIEGMFRCDDLDATAWLHPPGTTNRLTLRIRAQENAHRAVPGAPVRVRTQGPVAQSLYGWNWCPHLVCIGPWRPVRLVLRTGLYLEQVRVRTVRVRTAAAAAARPAAADADLEIAWHVRNETGRRRDVSLAYAIEGETFRARGLAQGRVRARVPAGKTRVLRERLTLKPARLWWPNGLGRAALHRLHTELSDGAAAPVERQTTVFGVRKLAWKRNLREQETLRRSGHTMRPWAMVGRMYRWTLTVNGWKVFMKGSNWVQPDSLLRLERARYDRLLRLARDSGVNMLRIWGGSLAETDDFFDLCDRYGILCWQEFWLACGQYPAMNHDLFLRCVEDTVRRLAHHACLTHYCGGNEYPPDSPENKALVDKIDAAVRRLDPEREFRRGSPYKGDRHGGLVLTPLVTRNKYLDILYGDRRIVLMRSEVATGRSTPMRSSLEKMIPEDHRWPIEESWWRNYFGVPCEFLGFANEYDALDSFPHSLLANHLAHGQLCRTNMEFCRTRMFRCSGNLNWQFNVPWPCMHRELVDHWGVPKPAFYYQMNASRPRAVVVDLERYLWHPGECLAAPVHAVNDLDALPGGRVRLRLFTTAGECLEDRTLPAGLPANAARTLGLFRYPLPEALAGKTVFLLAELEYGKQCLHRNLYWFAVSILRRPPCTLDLNGPWEREDGSLVHLPGNDMAIRNPSFEFVILKKPGQADFETQAELRARDGATRAVRYRRRFRLPSGWKGEPLEFFTYGIEGSDAVYVNGQRIGAHTMRGVTLDTRRWCFVPHGREEASIPVDPKSEYLFYSDPISLPKLQPRFYDIPARALEGREEHEIVIELKSYYQKAISHPLEIRPRTPNRKDATTYFRKGVFFSDLRRMPAARLETSFSPDGITVRNPSRRIAFTILAEWIPGRGGTALALDRNAFSLLPGETIRLRPLHGGPLPFPAEWRVEGWNVPGQRRRIKAPGKPA